MSTDALHIAALLAPAVGRLEVDPISGAVGVDDQGATLSRADQAALEVALALGETWHAEVVAVSAGGPGAEVVLREALAVGANRAVHVDGADGSAPDVVARQIVAVLAGATPVLAVAGVHGSDVAAAAVPACVAHELGAAQALGLVSVTAGEPGVLDVIRRLDRGARERLAVTAPAVISVEGSVATLRRASLSLALSVHDENIEQLSVDASGGGRSAPQLTGPLPYRPRPLVVAPPDGATALERIRDLTGAAGGHTPARTLELAPADAAQEILDELGSWGLGPRADAGA